MYENLMEEVVSPENYGPALKAVIANRGAPGIDGMKAEELNGHLLKHWLKIHAKLMAGTYTPSPVKRVEIPKPNGGKRMLGIAGAHVLRLIAVVEVGPALDRVPLPSPASG